MTYSVIEDIGNALMIDLQVLYCIWLKAQAQIGTGEIVHFRDINKSNAYVFVNANCIQ